MLSVKNNLFIYLFIYSFIYLFICYLIGYMFRPCGVIVRPLLWTKWY